MFGKRSVRIISFRPQAGKQATLRQLELSFVGVGKHVIKHNGSYYRAAVGHFEIWLPEGTNAIGETDQIQSLLKNTGFEEGTISTMEVSRVSLLAYVTGIILGLAFTTYTIKIGWGPRLWKWFWTFD